MASVFLSYAKPDSALVTRVYEDLTRAQVGDVWCYEITSKYGADFRHEYAQKIRSADTFILFDSHHARASKHVKEEVEICRSTGGIKMQICMTEPDGAWRKAELFERQNFLVYVDLRDYEKGIRALCDS